MIQYCLRYDEDLIPFPYQKDIFEWQIFSGVLTFNKLLKEKKGLKGLPPGYWFFF